MDLPFTAPEPYILMLLIALVAWLPLALKKLPLSLPIVCILIGAGIFCLPEVKFRPSPINYPVITERFSEFVVIIALMGAGLKLDRPFHWRRWGVTWRLLAITMPLGIGIITLMGAALLGLPWSIALLLAASLAPTDPVLAADVQVGPPRSGEEDEVRFGLTSEAGLNDGLAFPFVHLAIVLAASAGEPWFGRWFGVNVVWEVVAGVGGGWLIGKLFGWLTFHIPAETKLAKTGDGLIAIAATFISYGATEIINCYGFLAVFVTALTLRASHREHEFNVQTHDLTEQIERLAMMVLLLLFGGALITGLLAPLQAMDAAFVLLILLVVRPATGLVALTGFQANRFENLTIAFFGIRGVGSFYYLAYGLNHMDVGDPDRLWAVVGLAALVSILLHGLTVTPAMRWLDRREGRDPDKGETTDEAHDRGKA
jgi:sodium/hydrogen antiporter